MLDEIEFLSDSYILKESFHKLHEEKCEMCIAQKFFYIVLPNDYK